MSQPDENSGPRSSDSASKAVRLLIPPNFRHKASQHVWNQSYMAERQDSYGISYWLYLWVVCSSSWQQSELRPPSN